MRQFAVVKSPELNVRIEAGVSNPVKHKMRKGTRVELTGADKWFGPYRWVQVIYDLPSTLLGCGWVYAPYLEMLAPKPEQPSRWFRTPEWVAVALIVGLPAIVIGLIILIQGPKP